MSNALHSLLRMLERRDDERTGNDERDDLDKVIARRGRDLTPDDRDELKAWKDEQRRPGQ